MRPSESNSAEAMQAALDEFKAAYFAGQAPEIESFCRDHPESGHVLRERIMDFLYVANGFEQMKVDRPSGVSQAERFGQFRLLSCLGQGGMGTVHLAFDETLERHVALKQIKPEHLASLEARTRFEREARAVSRLNHPNLCPVFDAGQEGDVPYLIMQYMEGETLKAKIERAQGSEVPLLSLPDRASATSSTGRSKHAEIMAIAHMIEKVARALNHAHENGLVHRDIKPSNIMIQDSGEPIVLDFGLVWEEEGADLSLTASSQQLGTPMYMSPEQIVPTLRKVDRRTDVYALGVTLYECLTLSRPFCAPTRHQLFEKIVHEPPSDPRRLNSHIPRDLRVVVETAMEKGADRRYQTALDLAEDLRRVRGYEPIRAKRAGRILRAWRWSQRNPAAALLLLTLVAGIVLSTWLAVRLDQKVSEFDMLANLVQLRDATREENDLYPAWPEKVVAMRGWLDERATPLLGALPEIRSAVAALQQRTLPGEANPESQEREFAAKSDTFLYETLVKLIEDIKSFEKREVAGVKDRLLWATRVQALTIERYQERWDEARAAIGKADGVGASKLYSPNRIDLEPQIGLVPIGANPVTKLWAFYHLRSAWAPDTGLDPTKIPIPTHRDDGSIEVAENTGMVFVLVPGGRFMMGAQGNDPQALADEYPLLEVTVPAFFLSKYEMTQGQWKRLSAGEEPSRWKPGGKEVPATLAHPVELVSWTMCLDLVQRQGLALPGEAQWEFACRAGTATPWSSGAKAESLETYANLADRTAKEFVPMWSCDDFMRDGHAFHAPVGSFRPNGFGLYDMHGNVSEWCLDRHSDLSGDRVGRGGSFSDQAKVARSSSRPRAPREYRGDSAGLRPARGVH